MHFIEEMKNLNESPKNFLQKSFVQKKRDGIFAISVSL